MKYFLLLLFIVHFSCKEKGALKSTNDVLFDTINSPGDSLRYGLVTDSLNRKNEKDSFYAIKPLQVFLTDNKTTAIQKLIASVIDTTEILITDVKFTEVVKYRYDKDQMPVRKNTMFSNNDFKIQLIDEAYNSNQYKPKRLIINDEQQRLDKELQFVHGWEQFIYNLELDSKLFKFIRCPNRKYLYLQGYVEKCTGLACGVTYHIIYDPVSNKSFAFSQFRIDDLFVGYNKQRKELEFCVMEEGMFNESLGYFPMEAKVYRFSKQGKVSPLKNSKGEQVSFFSYFKGGDIDSLFVLKNNF